MQVFVLGHRGMLGHVVTRYLQLQGVTVLTTTNRYTGAPNDLLIDEVRKSEATVVINAIGVIKQRTCRISDFHLANAFFPIHLAKRLRTNQSLIHASSDCVFSGSSGGYSCLDMPDANDDYGLSKSISEVLHSRNSTFVLRTSIIGPELAGCYGLLQWLLTQTDPINGYANHYWNGITTLEWAKWAFLIIQGALTPANPIVQIGTAEVHSKLQVLTLATKVWNKSLTINAMLTKECIDRSLEPNVIATPLDQQLIELRSWYQPLQWA